MRFEDGSVAQFIESLSAKSPTPGGGAAASVTGALAAALAQMVVRYSQGKKELAEHASLHEQALNELAADTKRMLDLAQEDAEAYGALNALWKLDQDDQKRQREWSDAVRSAIDAPRQVLETSLAVLRRLDALTGRTTRMLDSDLAIAAILAEAAARSAAWNVRINLPLLDNDAARQSHDRDVAERLEAARSLAASIEARCRGEVQ